MSREDIYDHLAQVYLGKRKVSDKDKKRQYKAWLVINIVITFIIFACASYGLTAYLARKGSNLKSNVIYSLHQGLVKMDFDFRESQPPVKSFSLDVPELKAEKYSQLTMSLRAKEEGNPGIIKIVVKNERNEEAYYYVQGIDYKWKDFRVNLDEFTNITDWNALSEISFVLESWNVDKEKGIVLINDISFSGPDV